MGLTTDAFDPSPEEMKAATEIAKQKMAGETQLEVAKINAAAQVEKAKPQKPSVPMDQMHLAQATAAGKELGAPTAYKSGAGAPEPIQVIRRMTSTYAQPGVEGQGGLQEFASPLQAAQAYNRMVANKALAGAPTAADVAEAKTQTDKTGVTMTPAEAQAKRAASLGGEYIPPEGPLATLKAEVAGINPLRQAQATQLSQQQVKQKEAERVNEFKTDMSGRFPELAVEPEKMDRGLASDFAEAQDHYKKTGDMKKAQERYLENREIRTVMAPGFSSAKAKGVFQFMDENKQGLSPDRQEKLLGMLTGKDMRQKGEAMRFLLPHFKNYMNKTDWMSRRRDYEGPHEDQPMGAHEGAWER